MVVSLLAYEGAIKEYIRNQLQEDIAQDTLNFKEYTLLSLLRIFPLYPHNILYTRNVYFHTYILNLRVYRIS